jgi:hypothetical protein
MVASSLSKTKREDIWTESIAVGDADFLDAIKNDLGVKAKYKDIEKTEFDTMQLKEDFAAYGKPNLSTMIFLKPPF